MHEQMMDALSPDDSPNAGPTLERTHGRAMAAMSFSLSWNSTRAAHTDTLVMPKLNLWRDILPPQLEPGLMDQPVGHSTWHRFAPGELYPDYADRNCLDIPSGSFNRHFRKCFIEPRAGRYYPQGFIAGVHGIYPESITPMRLGEVDEEHLMVDLNHPLAGRVVEMEARILDIWEARAEHGGSCRDIAESAGFNGPGMQSRRLDLATDFWSDLPFARTDPGPDANFYRQPRLVHHLDDTARGQISALYERLLPQSARILDLMSSWTSHLPPELAPAGVTGLGMNAEELAANPLLTERSVCDLNLDPRLPYPDQSFDAAVCTASVEYLTKPLEVFTEIRRVLRPGGRFVLSFSDRWFPPKVIRIWQDAHPFERMGLVLEYFLRSGGFEALETWSLRGLPRPADDKYADRMSESDPIFAIWGNTPGMI